MQERIAEYRRIAAFGGLYRHAPALEATLADARGSTDPHYNHFARISYETCLENLPSKERSRGKFWGL